MTEPKRPSLLLDEMFNGTIAAELRPRGLDVTAVVEDISLVSTPDEDLLAYATEQRRVLVTTNVSDCDAIATNWRADGRTHPGLVYVTGRRFPQSKTFIASIVEALADLYETKQVPSPDTELFLTNLNG
jgi:predicted nuclease of predicted toxin-antitoxin system